MRLLTWTLAILTVAAPAVVFAAGTNEEVAQQIANSLRDSGKLKGYSIAIKYKDGTARLEGSVRSQQQLDQAVEIVKMAPDVKRVINNLSVDPNPAARPVSAQQASNQPSAGPAQTFREAILRRTTGTESPARTGSTPSPENQSSVIQASNNPSSAMLVPPQNEPQQFASAPIQAIPASVVAQANQPQVPTAQTNLQPQPAQTSLQPIAVAPAAQPIPYYAPATGRPQMVAYPQQMAGAPMAPVGYRQPGGAVPGGPVPEYVQHSGAGTAPALYDQPHMPNYSWPSYAAYPNYAALTYPKQYSPTAWPYIGPFYPYPQVPLGWRKVTLEWDDGWWFLNFADDRRHCGHGHW